MTSQTSPLGVDLPPGILPTPALKQGLVAARMLLATNRIAFYDGPPGTGKTTAATVIAHLAQRPVAQVTLPYRPAPLDVLRLVIQALTGRMGVGTKSEMEEECAVLLLDWQGLLIVDEVQNAGTPGIQTLRYLHDRSGCTFALLLVGWRALLTIKEHPDLDSRIIAKVGFEPLTGDTLITFLRQSDPRYAETPTAVLRHINDTYASGNLRHWNYLSRALDALGFTGPLDQTTATQVVSYMRTLDGVA